MGDDFTRPKNSLGQYYSIFYDIGNLLFHFRNFDLIPAIFWMFFAMVKYVVHSVYFGYITGEIGTKMATEKGKEPQMSPPKKEPSSIAKV